MGKGNDILARLADPSIKWYIYPALDFKLRVYGNITATNQTLYLCDDALCFPVRFSGYLSWFDPSAGNVGNKVFNNVREDWDHTNESNPTQDSYVRKAYWVAGYRGYFIAVILTDGTNKIQVNVIHRYTDGAILLYNTGTYAGSSVNLTVRVNDPPSGLGYSISTNGTRGTGYTDIAPGQYVLFYKGTAPDIDTTNGLFATSPIGSSKSQPYELYVPSQTFNTTIMKFVIPKIYLGIKSDTDRPMYTNGYFLDIFVNDTRSTIDTISVTRTPINASGYFYSWKEFALGYIVYDNDPYASATTWSGGFAVFKVWMGWGEDDGGNVKFIIGSSYARKHTTKWELRASLYTAFIYDIEKGELYKTGIIKPITDIYSYGKGGNVNTPYLVAMIQPATYVKVASAVGFMKSDDSYSKVTTATTTCWEYTDNIYGFCNYYNTDIVCIEGLGVYTNDTSISITNPKAVWRGNRCSTYEDNVGSATLANNAFADRSLYAGKLYIEVMRVKRFAPTTSDADLQTWFKQVTPKILTDSEVNGILSILPFSLYLYGENKDTVSVTAPTSVNPGQTFNVSVSCPNRAGKTVWVALLDANGNVVASASGTLDSSGNATVSLTAPSTTGTYRIVVVVAGDRTLP